MADSIGNLSTWDFVVIVGYFVAVMVVGIWSSCRNRGSVGGYFLAGRSMHWIPVGASLFASNIGSGHFVGLAGSGAASGLAIGTFELNAIFILILLGWFFVPVYMAANVFTMPEYLRKRFGGQRIRVYLTVLALLLYIFTKITADLYSGTIFIYQSLKIDFYVAVVILLVIAATFTIAGGLTAVIWTDTIQTAIMLIGAMILTIIGFVKVGGYEELADRYFTAIASTTVYANASSEYKYGMCGVPQDTAYNMVRPVDDPSGLPWPGVFIGMIVLSVWYWCSDQVIVQRALSSKNYSHVKAGCVFAGWLKFLPLWIMVVPGMISRVLYPDEIGCSDPAVCKEFCDQENGCTNSAYPTLVVRIMPSGLRGLMLAVMLSALMSSLTSVFNSASTLFTLDIWRLIRKNSSEVELMIVGRVFVLVLVGISIAWMPLLQSVPELFHYIQQITAFLSPPICAVYVLAICWKRINEQGAFWGLMIGLAVGLSRFISEYVYEATPPCGDKRSTPLPDIIAKVSYLHFAILLWGIVSIATVVISLLTKPIDDKHLVRLTFWDRFNTAKRVDIDEAEHLPSQTANGVDNDAYVSPDGVDIEKMDVENGHVDSEQPEEQRKKLPWYRTALNYACGIENVEAKELTPEEMEEIEKKNTSIHEKPGMARFLNLNAIFLMTCATFFWAFFG